MKLQIYLIAIFLCFAGGENAFSQKNANKQTISGFIRDDASGEDLIGATVQIKGTATGTITNVYGFYSLTLPADTYTIVVSYIGYTSITDEIDLNQSIKKDYRLKSGDTQLEAVVVTGEREDQNVTDVQMSVEKLTMNTVKQIPQLLGEADVIKSIQLRPGVTSVGEGASGFNVRGGNIDQNLILLDEAPVYNSSHLFGFFSVFNADAIKDVTLYKGGIPANYGGRLSSVMDVRQRDGNDKKFSGKGGIGVLFSRLTLEGPIVKDKVSFLVSGRRSYADVFLKLTDDFKDNQAYFYDLNAKVSWKINDKNRVFVSGYFGNDVFGFGDQFKMNWGNATGSARWNHIVNDKLFANLTFVYSNYNYSLGVPSGPQSFDWKSSIINTETKADFTYYLNTKMTVDFGAVFQYYAFYPGEIQPTSSESFFIPLIVQKETAVLPSGYVSVKHNVSKKLKLNYGLRYTHYFNIGPYNLNMYKYGVPTVADDIVEVKQYEQGEVVAEYGGLEPRIGVNYALSEKNSFKASYQRTKQYMHLVSNTTSATPIDIWKPAGYYVKPATADQYALGYFRNLKNNMYEFSSEVYYKSMRDLLDYRNGAELLLNDNLETELLSGKGTSYGLELMINKKKGNLTGWIAYTLSRTTMEVDGFVAGDYYGAANGINNGNPYPSNWDKTHDLTVVAMYPLSDKWKISGNFIFMTGRPATYPNGRYMWDGKYLPDYSTRNASRVPTTHRLDFSATYTPYRHGKNWKNSWSFGVYNLYGQKNPYSIFFAQDADNPFQTKAQQLSIVGIPVPFITYNFKF